MKKYLKINKQTYDLSIEYAKKNLRDGKEFYNFIINHLNKHLKNKEKILELGPGNGYVSKILSKKHNVMAIELSKERFRLTIENAPKAKIINDEFLSHNFKKEKFTVIIALAFIHLFPPNELKKVFKKIRDLLDENGILIINTTLHRRYKGGYTKRGDGLVRYRREFTKKDLDRILKFNGFNIIESFTKRNVWGNKKIIWINYITRKIE